MVTGKDRRTRATTGIRRVASEAKFQASVEWYNQLKQTDYLRYSSEPDDLERSCLWLEINAICDYSGVKLELIEGCSCVFE